MTMDQRIDMKPGEDAAAALSRQAAPDQQNLTSVGLKPEDPIIDPAPRGFLRSSSRSISFHHIMETGEVDSLGFHLVTILFPSNSDYSIDFKTDDKFNAAMSRLYEQTIKKIETDPRLQSLLKKDTWSPQDREKWEKLLNYAIQPEMIKEFGPYRTQDSLYSSFSHVKRNPQLNALGEDIGKQGNAPVAVAPWIQTPAGEKYVVEFDCEAMSLVKGMIMQKMDDKFLPKNTKNENDMKYAAEYRYNTGIHKEADTYAINSHAYIFSPATQNVIEGTSTQYVVNTNPGKSFQRVMQGEPVISPDGELYGPFPSIAQYVEEVEIETKLKNVEAISNMVGNYLEGKNSSIDDKQGLKFYTDLSQNLWQGFFESIEGKPELAAMAKETFSRNFLDRIKNSDIPVEDGKGGFKTLGQSVSEWAKPHMEKLDKAISGHQGAAMRSSSAAPAENPTSVGLASTGIGREAGPVVTTELHEYYNPLAAGQSGAQTLALTIPNVASPGASPAAMTTERRFPNSLAAAEHYSGLAADQLETLEQNPAMIHAKETLAVLEMTGMPQDALNDMSADLMRVINDPGIKPQLTTLERHLGMAEKGWDGAVREASGNSGALNAVRKSFQENYQDRFGNTAIPFGDNAGNITTLGARADAFAEKSLDDMSNALRRDPVQQMQSRKNDQTYGLG
ncbi:MAG: hypothetical protein HY370_05030 [Proteobacteria bacterium]|nr:hypothetical protein [Pseudomonadota bacterium]